jgi:hypothetical protein
MKIAHVINLGLLMVLFLFSGFASERVVKASAAAPPALKEEIIGTWRLTSRIVRQADGSESFDPRFGQHPVGYISYDRVGHMSIQQMRPDRPKNDPTNGYEAYFGTYTVDEEKKTVTHHIEGDMLSDRVGQDLRREFEIKGDELTLIVQNRVSETGKPVTILMHYTRIGPK